MLGHSHLLIAAGVYTALALHPVATPMGIVSAPALNGGGVPDAAAGLLVGGLVATAAGLAPDLDRAGSTAARSGGLVTRLTAWGIQHALGHRGPFHSALAVVVAWVLGEAAGGALGVKGLGASLALGWAVHLATDSWTVRGVPLFWPIPLRVQLPPGFRTGGRLEGPMLAIALVACGAWAVLAYLPGGLGTAP